MVVVVGGTKARASVYARSPRYDKLIRQTEEKKDREPGELEFLLQEAREAEEMALDELNSVSSQNLLHQACLVVLRKIR